MKWSIYKKPVVSTDPGKIEEILTRGVEDVFVKELLKKRLMSGKELRVKLGFDPTGSKIHIGRAIALRKLKAFQDLGHKVVFIVGDFTAQIGDPSDKLEKRPMLTSAKVMENLKDYKRQIGKIIDLSRAEFHFNSRWLSKLTFKETCELSESFTVQQMLARRNFKDRFDQGQEISLREFLYPLMQGYDSVQVKADIEIGGFDQLFNLKAGRVIQKHYGQTEQDVLTIQMLEGTDGRKMSTSWGNVINIIDEPFDMYGKIMSMKDELISKYFLLATDASLDEIKEVENSLKAGASPRDIKMRLARTIVSLYHGDEAGKNAEAEFVRVHQEKQVPEKMDEIRVSVGAVLGDVLVENKIVNSKNEWRRLIQQNGVHSTDGEVVITDDKFSVTQDTTIRIGKRKFVKIICKK